jgi:hypothetical protein
VDALTGARGTAELELDFSFPWDHVFIPLSLETLSQAGKPNELADLGSCLVCGEGVFRSQCSSQDAFRPALGKYHAVPHRD